MSAAFWRAVVEERPESCGNVVLRTRKAARVDHSDLWSKGCRQIAHKEIDEALLLFRPPGQAQAKISALHA